MKKQKSFSLFVFLLCVFFTMQFEAILSQASKAVDEDYKLTNQVYFNLNNDFEYRAQIFSVEEAFVIVGRTSVQYISAEGELMWEKDVSSQNVSVAKGIKVFALAEKKAGDIFVLNSKGEILKKRFSVGAIESIKVFNDHYFGILKKDHEFLLLDSNLKTIGSTILPKGVVIDYDVDVENQNIALLVLDLNRAEFNSKLIMMSFNGSIISGSNIQGKIAYGIHLKPKGISIVADSGMLYYGPDGKLRDQYESEQVVGSFLLEDPSWLYLTEKASDVEVIDSKKEKIIAVDDEGKVEQKITPPISGIKGIERIGKKILVYNEEMLVIINDSGKVEEKYKGEDEIFNVHLIGKKGFAIEYMNHLDIYSLK